MERARLALGEPWTARGRMAVTAAAPEAARTGLEMLRAGGNAFDAVVAAGLVETVWLPMKCGLAGDAVALIREAGGAWRVLVSIGAGPAALALGATLERVGPRSVGAPGAPAAYAGLAKLGRFALADLVEPAALHAERGVTWLPTAVSLTRQAEAGLRRHNGALVFLPEGALPEAGAPLILKGLAGLLRQFAGAGAGLFHGEIGALLAKRVQAAGGFIEAEDLARDMAEWTAPDERALPGGERLLVTPMPTHGPLLAAALARALAGEDTLSAFQAARAGFAPDTGGGTSVVTAADAEGNAVVLVHSNSFPQYGAGLVLEEFDLVLNNRPGRGFTLDAPPGHWNAPAVGRRPFTTLNAWGLERDGALWLGATPGGANQAPWNLQVLDRLLAGDSDLARLVAAPRWGFDPQGEATIEADHPQAGALPARIVPARSLRSAEQIVHFTPGEAERRAGADPRMGAMALAAD